MSLELVRNILLFSCFIETVSTHAIQDCLTKPEFDSMISCLSAFIIKTNHGTVANGHYPPTDNIRSAFYTVAYHMLSVDNNCTVVAIPTVLADSYVISDYTDSSTGKSYCIFHEITADASGKSYQKGWGLFAVPKTKSSVQRQLHLSTPHPITDGPVHLQAAALFHRTNSASLLFSTSVRDASDVVSSCGTGCSWSNCYISDGGHDNSTAFYSMARATVDWQKAQITGCPSSNCAFIQFHGKSEAKCPSDSVFISAGLHQADYYQRETGIPAVRLQKALVKSSGWTVSTPANSDCNLTAGSNVLGRLLNGVPPNQACNGKATVGSATGQFVHAEQSSAARQPAAYHLWTEAIISAFP